MQEREYILSAKAEKECSPALAEHRLFMESSALLRTLHETAELFVRRYSAYAKQFWENSILCRGAALGFACSKTPARPALF